MSSISDTLHIASHAIENALTASSTKRVDPTSQLSRVHNHRKKAQPHPSEEVIKQTEKGIENHIDLRV